MGCYTVDPDVKELGTGMAVPSAAGQLLELGTAALEAHRQVAEQPSPGMQVAESSQS